jgi:polyferredoxin
MGGGNEDESMIPRGRFWAYLIFLALFVYIFLKESEGRFWFFYTVLYTSLVIVFGIIILKGRKEGYIRMRTVSLILAQLFMAFLLPFYVFTSLGSAIMLPWPLEIRSFYPGRSLLVLVYGVFLLLVLMVLVYLFGKRVFCSFLCTCGALAETVGDPFRKKAPKTDLARALDMRELVLLAAIIVTFAAFLGDYRPAFGYLLVVNLVIAHAVALSAYPFYGGRIWCRYFCPLGSILGRISAIGRFAIITDPRLCTSCEKCSMICHMGIDIAKHASKGEPIKHRHCVGCGECVYACPKGALKLK